MSTEEAKRRRQTLLWPVHLVSLALLVIAKFLRADPSGLGTHQQLGLPPCGFWQWTQLPCPACGMTTAFAAMADGQFEAAVRAQPLGVMFFLLTALFCASSALALAQKWSLSQWLRRVRLDFWCLLLPPVLLLSWALRIGLARGHVYGG